MSTIPCKRPRVTVTPRTPGDDRHDADCHVPGCSWTYPADKQFMALKSDANDQATRHRGKHRAAVPDTHVERFASGYWQGHCSGCGWWTDGPGLTKAQAQAGVEYHLSSEHGLVSC